MSFSECLIQHVRFEGLGDGRRRDEPSFVRPALDAHNRLDPNRIVGGTEALVGYNVADDVRESMGHAVENAEVGGAPVGATDTAVGNAVKEGPLFIAQGVVLGR